MATAYDFLPRRTESDMGAMPTCSEKPPQPLEQIPLGERDREWSVTEELLGQGSLARVSCVAIWALRRGGRGLKAATVVCAMIDGAPAFST